MKHPYVHIAGKIFGQKAVYKAIVMDKLGHKAPCV